MGGTSATTSGQGGADWSPLSYARFGDLRLRPALDLLAQVGPLPDGLPDALPDGTVIDLGCGNGAAGPALAARFPGRVTGMDSSPAMLKMAAATGAYARLAQADIATWQPPAPPALIFSNAVLHWLPDHAGLMPRLLGHLAPGGTLAVQMPGNHDAPSHRLLRDLAQAMFPDRFSAPHAPPVLPLSDYWRLLTPHAAGVTLWDTTYLQQLPAAAHGHPVRAFTESTAMRPFVARLSADEAAAFTAAYDAALLGAYPLLPDGGALFPFRRVFFVAKV